MSEVDLARAEAEASEWFTRLKRTQISTDELYSFQAWRRDPDNAAAFTRVEKAGSSPTACARIQRSKRPPPPLYETTRLRNPKSVGRSGCRRQAPCSLPSAS